jgi:thiol-disulfide isomerase/thioredoxin/uncharacterized membrane protein YphA (DoxX/SURF4 family)
MDTVILCLRALLSAVFVLAAFTKLRDRAGFRNSLVEFGLPPLLTAPLSTILPLTEMVVGLALLPARSARLGSVGALVLLSAFIIAIGIALAKGRRPNCNCFGQILSKPIGWNLVVRNLGLALIPSLLLAYGPPQPSLTDWISGLTPVSTLLFAFGLACCALLCVQSWLTFQLIQQGGRVLLRLDEMEKSFGRQVPAPAPLPAKASNSVGLPIGVQAPDFTLADSNGERVSLTQFRTTGKPTLLLFTSPHCGPCLALMPEIAQWQRHQSPHFNLAIISEGALDENRKKFSAAEINTFLLQEAGQVSDAYLAPGTPAAVLIRPDGTIGSPIAAGSEPIRSLVANTINESLAGLVTLSLGEGEAVPPLTYPDLNGGMLSLSTLRGASSILLFWNPGCGYCQKMLDDVKAWERQAASDTPRLLVISSGTVEANRQLGLRSLIVLDQNFSAGKALGVGGTPSALLLDAHGRIVSKVAVGRDQILNAILRHPAGAGKS